MEHITRNKKINSLLHNPCSMLHESGFTLLEIIIVVFVLTVLGAITIPNMALFQKTPQLNNTFEEVANTLRIAQNKTLSSEGNSRYGVYFKTTVTPHQYILFKGDTYASRDSSYDQTYPIPGITEFYGITTQDDEVVFNKLTGSTENSGSISLRLIEDTSQMKTIYIDNAGVIGATAPQTPSDTRIKDARHINFTYNRTIVTNTEDIILTFNGSTIETIPMNQYLATGQFDWTGTVNAGGFNQTVRIHTNVLNSPETQFSVFRDMRFNDKSLVVEISGDNTGALAEYSANGLTVNGLTSIDDCSTGATGLSIYVSNCLWQ